MSHLHPVDITPDLCPRALHIFKNAHLSGFIAVPIVTGSTYGNDGSVRRQGNTGSTFVPLCIPFNSIADLCPGTRNIFKHTYMSRIRRTVIIKRSSDSYDISVS